MMRIANALGVIHKEMKFNARSAASGTRFIEGLNKRLAAQIEEVDDDHMALLHPNYLLWMCDDNQKRLLLHRAASWSLGFAQRPGVTFRLCCSWKKRCGSTRSRL